MFVKRPAIYNLVAKKIHIEGGLEWLEVKMRQENEGE